MTPEQKARETPWLRKSQSQCFLLIQFVDNLLLIANEPVILGFLHKVKLMRILAWEIERVKLEKHRKL